MANKMEVFAFWRKPGIVPALLSLAGIQVSMSLQAQTWISNNVPNLSWMSVASSADGGKLAAAPFPGPVYVSPDGGVTWNATTSPFANWTSLASSADGSVFLAAASFSYLSTNSGATWRLAVDGNRAACSADGQCLFSLLSIGNVYISTNKGDNWVLPTPLPSQSPGPGWSGIACSGNASRIVVISGSGALYASSDLARTWTSNSVPDTLWSSLACSADGTKWAVAAGMANGRPGPIYFSTDGATNWNPAVAPITNWAGLCSSADGRTMFASTASDGQLNGANAIYRSTDFGASWTRLSAPTPWWRGIATSANTGKLVVAAIGPIYTAQFSQTPMLNILSTTGTVSLSWVIPSTHLVLQQTSDLPSGNWTGVGIAPSFDPTTLRQSVNLPASASNRFYRMTLAP
jgi:hypothetical protein